MQLQKCISVFNNENNTHSLSLNCLILFFRLDFFLNKIEKKMRVHCFSHLPIIQTSSEMKKQSEWDRTVMSLSSLLLLCPSRAMQLDQKTQTQTVGQI